MYPDTLCHVCFFGLNDVKFVFIEVEFQQCCAHQGVLWIKSVSATLRLPPRYPPVRERKIRTVGKVYATIFILINMR